MPPDPKSVKKCLNKSGSIADHCNMSFHPEKISSSVNVLLLVCRSGEMKPRFIF